MSDEQTNPTAAFEERTEGRVADAMPENWVDTHAPPALLPYLRLSRMDRPIGTWLLLLPCFWGIGLAVAADPFGGTWWDLWYAFGCAIGALLMRGAGCTWNDITDVHFDAQVERTKSRPLPSGQVTIKQAIVWMVLQAALAFLVLLTFYPFAIMLAIASLGLVLIYPYAKRFTWWPQLFLGLAFNWGALLGWSAHYSDLGWPAVWLYGAGICWTLFYDTIYAHQDKEDDALIGVRSTARLFGRHTGRWLVLFTIGSVSLMGIAVIEALIDIGPLPLLIALFGAWGFGWHMTLQLRRLDIDDPERCHALFQSNRDAGLIPVAAFAVAMALAAIA
ncbi:4-hydroxybenzoate octaprenyltransferase [Halovulum sp. GXIMD14793]